MLNDSQRTSLSIALRLADQQLRAIESVLERPQENRVMYEIRDDLTPAMRQRLPVLIEAVNALIKELRDMLHLHREVAPASRQAFKGLPILWEVLQESTSARLRRYGEVDPRLGSALDPELKKLESLLMEMEEILFVPRRREASVAAERSSREKGRAK